MAGSQSGAKIGFHVGRALTTIIARHYPTLRDTVLELVQNGIDANARTIWITWDERRRILTVQDDGDGVSVATMNQRLQLICASGKGEADLGEFGIGVVSPIDKCEAYTFTSAPRVPPAGADGAYHRWAFRFEDVKDCADLNVPCDRMGQMSFAESQTGIAGMVQWRTEARMERVLTDSIRSKLELDDLKYQIQQRFSVAMRHKNVRVAVTLSKRVGSGDATSTDTFGALDYTGEPLERWTIRNRQAGLVSVKLYLRRVRPGRQGPRIEVGEARRDYRLTLTQFSGSAGSLLSQSVRDALGSGVLEGEITAENIRITPNRRGVEPDDALVGLCEALEEWHGKVGSQIVADTRHSRNQERWQKIGEEVLGGVDDMLRDPAFVDWREAVKSFRVGTVGTGHVEPSSRQVVGTQVQTSVRVNRGGTSGSGKSGSASDRERVPATIERVKDMPLTVAGPRGQARTVVKKSSFGIQVIFDVMPGSADLWSLNPKTGELMVNVRHPNWAACERSDKDLADLLRRIVEHALAWNATPDDWKPQVLLGLGEAMRGYMFLRAAAVATREKAAPRGEAKAGAKAPTKKRTAA